MVKDDKKIQQKHQLNKTCIPRMKAKLTTEKALYSMPDKFPIIIRVHCPESLLHQSILQTL